MVCTHQEIKKKVTKKNIKEMLPKFMDTEIESRRTKTHLSTPQRFFQTPFVLLKSRYTTVPPSTHDESGGEYQNTSRTGFFFIC